MVFPTNMVPIGQQAVGFFNHVGGEGLARGSAEAGARANKTANDTTARAVASPGSGASALADLDGRNDSALSMSYCDGKNHERERGENRAQFWHGLASCGLRSRTILHLKANATQL